jgi:hypothetical protein
MVALRGDLGRKARLLGTLKDRSYQYPETGWETDFGPQSDSKGHVLSFNRRQTRVVIGLFI